MGMGVTIHGYIATPSIIEGELDEYRHNRLVIRSIPVDWANHWIIRGMFNMPRYRHGKGASIPHYDVAPISFAANYKEMLRIPVEWIAEFEAILRRLYWEEAIVISEFTTIRYEWSLEPGVVNNPAHPADFKLRCSAGKLEELPFDLAIDGDYSVKGCASSK
jgi:hypothetical protein